jgi:signal peptidase
MKKIAEYLMTGIVIVLLLAAVLIFFAPRFGWQVDTVLSGSMEPAIPTGSILVSRTVASDSINVGDIITFSGSGRDRFITHRVTAIDRTNGIVFTTKGDANNAEDPYPVPAENVVGKVLVHIPFLGFILSFVKTPLGILLMLVIPGLLIIGLELREFWDTYDDA